MEKRIKLLVDKLDLQPHPEGGFFKETYRSDFEIEASSLPNKFSGNRNICTSIYFLLTSNNFSAFHRIKSDEIWHFYDGSSLFVHVIYSDGSYKKHVVGMNLEEGETPQLVVPAGCWFGSSVKESDSYSLVGCTVSPGFDFKDFELANRKELLSSFPDHESIINSLSRE